MLQPPAGDGATLLSAGELVEGHGIQRVYGDVGFLDDGTVTIRVRARRAPGPYVCVTGDVKKFCDARGRPSAGTPVTIARAASIFRSRSGTVAALVRPGDDLPGAGPLADVEHFIVRGGSVTFVGILVDGRRVLARRSDHGTTVVAADGTTVGSYTITLSILYATRGTLSLVGATLVDASGAELEDASGLALINGRGAVDQLLRPRADRRFGTASAAVFTSGGPVVLSDNPDGLLALRRGRLHPVLVAGKRAARGVATLDAMAASGSSLVLLGTSASGGSALYALHAGRFGRLLALPDVPSAFAGGVGADVALVVTPSSPGAGDQAWTVHDGHATVVAAIGDATPLGTLESIDAVALDARTVVLASGVAGTGPHRALLTTPR